MPEEGLKINCPLFQKQGVVIEALIDKINRTKRAQEKAEISEVLRKEMDVIFSCPDYDENSLDCKNCHFIANIRKRTIELIIRVSKLA